MTTSKFIQRETSRLHYVEAGQGSRTLLFFHGFGQDHTIYIPLIRSLSNDFRIFIFDLFFHGSSEWNEGEVPLEKQHWRAWMEDFMKQENISFFSMCAYSLGGKFAFATLELFPDRVKQLYLIAPDGVKTNFWYSLATWPWMMRKFFRSLIHHHQRFLFLANQLNKFHLVDKGLVRFALYQMDTPAKRERVFMSWVVFRHLRFSMPHIARLINDFGIKTTLIVGKHDKVITPAAMQHLLRHLSHCSFEVIDCGHTGLIYKSLPFIR